MDVADWDCYCIDGRMKDPHRFLARSEFNSTPEQAMERLLKQAQRVFGHQDWSSWEWWAREYGPGPTTQRKISFRHDGQGLVRD